jgi:hypothetical protein
VPSDYPGAFDDLGPGSPSASSPRNNPSLAGEIRDLNEAVDSVQQELGLAPSGTEATVAARLATLSSHATSSHAKTFRIGHTWAIAGEVKVASGQTDYIVPFFFGLAGVGHTGSLVRARHRLNGGTSATVELRRNDVAITGFTGINVTQATGETAPVAVTLANTDLVALVVTAVNGGPQNMTFTIFVDHVVA